MIFHGGHTHYGHAIGILTLDTHFPRIPGDVGNATSYPFPVTFKKVIGATVPRVVTQGDPTLLPLFIAAAKELEQEGVRAITTSCGFLILFQDALANAVTVPVFTSSLMMVPLVYRLLGSHQQVGLLTADASALTPRHLQAAGIDATQLAVAGMQDQPEFAHAILHDNITIDPMKVTQEMIQVAQELIKAHPKIGALVLECANMPPYTHALHNATGLPVFDLNHFITFIYHAVVVQERFSTGFL
jgi:maleate cis-trans isomerase